MVEGVLSCRSCVGVGDGFLVFCALSWVPFLMVCLVDVGGFFEGCCGSGSESALCLLSCVERGAGSGFVF